MNKFAAALVKSPAFPYLWLLLASGVGVALVMVRFVASFQFSYWYLVPNLFLAWVPVGLGYIA